MPKKLRLQFVDSINAIDANEWNTLNCLANSTHPETKIEAETNNIEQLYSPFTRHEFLAALENSGSVSQKTGWKPCHIAVYSEESNKLIAAMPLYLKTNSYGEYVFDWSWADAYQQHGLNYYPKLVTAVPFSPVSGARLLIGREEGTTDHVFELICNAVANLADELKASSWHILFPKKNEAVQWSKQQLLQRQACQFHWYNESFTDFDDFLSTFTSRKRKNIRKERKRVQDQGIELQHYSGHEITPEMWREFYQFYHYTYYKRGGAGYLTEEFFKEIATSMPEQLLMAMATRKNKTLGAALCFRDNETLYGRYWGCAEEYDYLHFEACYYQGIDYCIAHGLQRFDPGAQGEHKIQRGFIPVYTWSYHWLARPDFSAAIEAFLKQECEHISTYRKKAQAALPFNQIYLDSSKHQSLLKQGENQAAKSLFKP